MNETLLNLIDNGYGAGLAESPGWCNCEGYGVGASSSYGSRHGAGFGEGYGSARGGPAFSDYSPEDNKND